MGKTILSIIAIVSVTFGLSFIFAPHMFFELYTGATLPTASAATDIRTTYGGFSLGFGLFLLYCLKNNLRIGLMAALLVLTTITAARIFGITVDGNPNKYMYIFLGMEVVSLVLVFLVWWRKRWKQTG